MAIDPNQIAADQNQLSALAAQGMPTEFAEDPANSVKVAGKGSIFELIGKMGKSVTDDFVPPRDAVTPSAVDPVVSTVDAVDAVPTGDVDPVVSTVQPAKPQQPGRVPTGAEKRNMQNPGAYSEGATKRLVAPQVLSEDGLAKFKAMGYKADGTPPGADPLLTAQQALDAQTAESAVDVNELAERALNADKQGFKPTTAVASDEATDLILEKMAVDKANIKTLADGTGDFNFDYIDGSEDVQKLINSVSEALADEQVLRTRGKIPENMTINEAAGILADEIGFSKKLLNRKIGEGALSAAEFVAARTIMVSSADKLAKLAEKLKPGGGGTASDRLRFRRQLAIHQGIQLQLKGAQTEAARALQSFQIKIDGEMDLERFDVQAQLMMDQGMMGEAAVTDRLAASLLSAMETTGKLQSVNKIAEVGYLAKGNRVVTEAYMAGLLSSLPTQVKNAVASPLFMAYQIPAEIVAGMFGSVSRGVRGQLGMNYPIGEEQVYVADALLRIRGWSDSYRDALKSGSIAWETEIPTGDADKLNLEEYTSIEGGSDSVFSRAISEFGKRVRIPFRLLLSADEFFKTMSQRGELYVQSHQDFQTALRNGATQEEAQDAAGMRLLDPGSINKVLDDKAKYDTMQTDLGLFGKATSYLQNIPLVGRVLMPFVTAPTNSILRSAEFMWINPRVWKELFDPGSTPKQQQNAVGRLSLGGATMWTVGQYAMDGQLTGAMPRDAKVREALPPKWQPYSFVTRGEGFPEDMPLYDDMGRANGPLNYTSYSGFDPVSTIIGFAANAVQRQMMTRDAGLREAYAMSAVMSTVDYYKEMPTLQALGDLERAIESGDPTVFFRGPANAAIAYTPLPSPVSALQRSVQRMRDPTLMRPRDDIEYYTLADVLEETADENGNDVFVHDLYGEPNYNLIGLPKTSDVSWTRVLEKVKAMQAQDSFVFDETNAADPTKGRNVRKFDTLGNAHGADGFSLATNPVMAVFNSVSGIRVSQGEKPKEYELELVRVFKMTNEWPLTNPEEISGVRLSDGVQSDLIDLAKNQTVLNNPMGQAGLLTFKQALQSMLTNVVRNKYTDLNTTDKQKISMIRELNTLYVKEATVELLNNPNYANLAVAVRDTKENALIERGKTK